MAQTRPHGGSRWWVLFCFGSIWIKLHQDQVLGFAPRRLINDPRSRIESGNGHRNGILDSISPMSAYSNNGSMRNQTSRSAVPPAYSNPFFPTEVVDLLRESVDIISVIESYELESFKRTGDARATCICPFHDDHNPSLSIDGKRQIFKCFSCGAGGNVFNFVRDFARLDGQELSFPQAVLFVNEHFAEGDVLSAGRKSYYQGPKFQREMSTIKRNRPILDESDKKLLEVKRNRIAMANLAAAAFYEDCLVSRDSAGAARTHLRQRGISPRTARAFSMGYAPDSYFLETERWGEGSLVGHLKSKGFEALEIIDAGLATITKGYKRSPNTHPSATRNCTEVTHSQLIDRFRGRLVIPIFDATGAQILGFGGRLLRSEPTPDKTYVVPKYLNSPESELFKKKNIIFGQHMANKALRFWCERDNVSRSVVIVEGYLDVIALWQAGVEEAVSCMGTGLTTAQITEAAKIAGKGNGKPFLFWNPS